MSYDSEVAADTPQVYCKLYTNGSDFSTYGRSTTVVGTVGTHVKWSQPGNIATDSGSLSVLLTDATGTEFNNASTTGAMGYIKVPSVSTWGYTHDKDNFSAEIWYRAPTGMTGAWAAMGNALMSRRKTTPVQWQITGTGVNVWTLHPGMAGTHVTWGSSPPVDPGHWDTVYGADYESGINPTNLPQIRFASSFDALPHMHTMVFDAGSLWGYFDGIKNPTGWNSGIPARGTNTADPLIIAGSYSDTQSNGVFGYYSNASFHIVSLSQARVLKRYQASIGTVVYLNTQWSFSGAKGMSLAASANMITDIPMLRAAPLACDASARVASSIAQNQRLGVAFMDDVSINASIAVSPLLTWVLANTVNVNAALGFNSIQQFEIHDIVLAGIAIQVGEETFNGWVINPTIAASVSLEGFGFNSFAQFQGQYYGAKQDGIYHLQGNTDGGEPIQSYIALPKSNFGSTQLKRVPAAYIGAASDGTMVLRVVTNGAVRDYKVRNPTTDLAEQRVDIGRGIRSNYWQFEMFNPDGADFDIDTIKFLPVILERRI